MTVTNLTARESDLIEKLRNIQSGYSEIEVEIRVPVVISLQKGQPTKIQVIRSRETVLVLD